MGAGAALRYCDVAERLGVSERTVRRLVAAGELAAYKRGRVVRIFEADLERHISGQRVRAQPSLQGVIVSGEWWREATR